MLRKSLLSTSYLTLIGVMFGMSCAANAGSNNGGAVVSSQSCDSRVSLEENFLAWCSLANAEKFKNECYAVIHTISPVQRCGWQGCGHFSLIGKKATLSNANVLEYGVASPNPYNSGAVPASWQKSGSDVLPKAPFPRTYLTVSQFVSEREACVSGAASTLDSTARNHLCQLDANSLALSPYYTCMKFHKLVP